MEGVEEDVDVQRFREQIAEGIVYLACTGLKEHGALADRIEVPPMPSGHHPKLQRVWSLGLL